MEQTETSALAKDLIEIDRAAKPVSELMVMAANETGINPFKVSWDYKRLKRRGGQLRFDEYYRYGLHVQSEWQEGERERFISSDLHWPVFNAISPQDYRSITDDKWICEALLRTSSLPTSLTVGVIDHNNRLYPGLQRISSVEDLRTFIARDPNFPLFAKVQNSGLSAGAFVIDGVDGDTILVRDELPMSFEAFLGTYIGGSSYILQEMIKPHRFFADVTKSVATVRITNLMENGELSHPFAVLRIPVGDNIADNIWRSGNLICNVDFASGEIASIVTQYQTSIIRHDKLPGTERKFIGEMLPYWRDVCELNEAVALTFGQIPFGSTDIAITKDGPVVVDVNCGSSFETVQIATGKGFLTDEVRDFFQSFNQKVIR